MLDNTEITKKVVPVSQELFLREIVPTIGTFLKVFWSATWRCNIYFIPFEFFLLYRNESRNSLFFILSTIVIGTFCLFFAMRKLNLLYYSQGKDLIVLKITDKTILFYLLLVSIPYLSVFLISVVFFGKSNEVLQLFLAVVPNLAIFHRMMTKGIMGFRIVTSRVIPKEGMSWKN